MMAEDKVDELINDCIAKPVWDLIHTDKFENATLEEIEALFDRNFFPEGWLDPRPPKKKLKLSVKSRFASPADDQKFSEAAAKHLLRKKMHMIHALLSSHPPPLRSVFLVLIDRLSKESSNFLPSGIVHSTSPVLTCDFPVILTVFALFNHWQLLVLLTFTG